MNQYVNDYFSSMPQSYTDELMHYGVLGMKWGKRKAMTKEQRKERRQAIKSKTKELRGKASIGEKLMYNKATHKKAAKNMIDKNMSEDEAMSKAKKTAWRNTGLAVAGSLLFAYGAKKLNNNRVIDIKNNEQKGKETLEGMMKDMEKIKVSWEAANRDLGMHYIKTRGADKTRFAVNNTIRKKNNIVADI